MGALENNVEYSAHLSLTGTIEALIRLLIELQAPCQPKPDEDMPTVLEIESVTYRGGVGDGDRDLPGIPVFYMENMRASQTS